MLGIIVLQLFWMKNAMQVRNELFDRSVKEAMMETSKRMETLSDVLFIQNMVQPGLGHSSNGQAPGIINFRSQNISSSGDTIRSVFTRKFPSRKKIESTVKIISSNTDDLQRNIQVEYVEMDSVISDLENRIDQNFTVWVDSAVEHMELDSSFLKREQEFSFRFDHRAQRLKNVAGQMVYESWVMDKIRVPDTSSINRSLSEELRMRNIPIQYEYGVFSSNGGLVKKETADSVLLANSNYSAKLYPNEIITKGDKLALYFPGRKAFVFKKLIGPAIMSILFCSLILVVFGLSIFYILNQKKISEMKSDFINNMTHEFKTPLATISVAADTIVNPKIIADQEKVKYFTGVIKKENQRMNQQVESILQIARLDRKDLDFHFKVQNIHEIIDKAVHIISLQVENRNGTIGTNFIAQNTAITTDATHALNLLNNLLDNANKYSNDRPEIMISTRNSDRGVWVMVSDKGIGMSKQVQQKIFEKFYRETSGNIHNVKGFGLGLSYVKAVVDANKGEIKVSSELGKGSTFEVFFPFSVTDG